jgi:hypothetical protein
LYDDHIEYIRKIKLITRKYSLKCPSEFLPTPNCEVAEKVNGCGPEAAFDGRGKITKAINRFVLWIIPDTLPGDVDLSAPCAIHDWMYSMGYDKDLSDSWLKENIEIMVDRTAPWYLFGINMAAAELYYISVHMAGKDAYEKAKENTNV